MPYISAVAKSEGSAVVRVDWNSSGRRVASTSGAVEGFSQSGRVFALDVGTMEIFPKCSCDA